MNFDNADTFLEVSAISRPNHTPELRCAVLLKGLEEHAIGVFGDGGRDYFHSMASSLWDGRFKGAGGDEFIADLMRDGDAQPDASQSAKLPREFFHLTAGMAYAIKAIHTWKDGREGEAWDLAFDAAQHDGVLSGLLIAQERMQPSPSKDDWQLIEPLRGDVLSRVMYDTLKAEKDKGHRRPTFTQMFSQWLASRPPQFLNIMQSEVTMLDEHGDAKTYFVDAVNDRYKRMTGQKKKSGTSKKGR